MRDESYERRRDRWNTRSTSLISGAFNAPIGAAFYAYGGGWWTIVVMSVAAFLMGLGITAWLAWKDAMRSKGTPTGTTGSVRFEPAVTNLPSVLRMDGLSAAQCEAMVLEVAALKKELAAAERRALAQS